jgi:hypothetical protein
MSLNILVLVDKFQRCDILLIAPFTALPRRRAAREPPAGAIDTDSGVRYGGESGNRADALRRER